jgi:signal transduction histidine kinase
MEHRPQRDGSPSLEERGEEGPARRRERRLASLCELTAAVTRASALEETCEAALHCLAEMLGVERSAVLLYDAEGVMRFRAWRGLSDAYRAAVEGHSPWTRDARDPSPILVSDVEFAPELATYRALFARENIRALGFIPLVYDEQLLGKFMLYYGEAHAFSEDDVDVARAVAGHVGFAIGAQRAADSLRQARDGLERQKLLLETVLASLPVGVVARNAAGRLLWKNAAVDRMALRIPEDLTPETAPAVRRPSGAPMAPHEWPAARALRGEVIQEEEILWDSAHDGVIQLALSATPVHDDKGELVAAVSTFRDVTAERSAEQRRADHRRFLEQFVGIVGHDLRSPLTAIQMAAAALSHTELNERQFRAVERVLSASARSERLIRDLLDFARARIGAGIPIQRAPADLREIARQIVDEHAHTGRGIVCEASGDGRGEWDADRIAQVVSNLVGNALQYSPPETDIHVTVEDAGDDVVVSTQNGGGVIPPELLPRIFEPFFRATPSAGDHPRSVGLGLYIVAEVVRAHGGTVSATSDAREGTRFRVVLPRRPPAGALVNT